MKVLHETPVLVAKTSTGKDKFWKGFAVVLDTGEAATFSEFWQEGAVKQQATPSITEGKNIGRANETTPEEQAVMEIKATEALKRKKGYTEQGSVDVNVARQIVLPMLAHAYEKRGKGVAWPLYIQPKLNGVRCLSDGARFWSRQGNLFDSRVTAHLQVPELSGVILDGELMLDHREYTFQEGISATKKFDMIRSPKLIYFVYDCIVLDSPKFTFAQRFTRLREKLDWLEKLRSLPKNIQLVVTPRVDNEAEFKKMHSTFVQEGFEGSILRTASGVYAVGQRSTALLKHKDFIDAEFEILGGKEGTGKDAGTIIFRCRTEDGQEFDVRPRGTHAERTEMWDNLENYINKKLTVRYQTLTDDGKPLFPVGIAVRDYE